jgi:LasA protease
MNDTHTSARASRRVPVLLLALGLLGASSLLAIPESGAQSADEGTLQEAVVQEMHGGEQVGTLRVAEDSAAGPDQVNVHRSEHGWAFGTAVIPAPNKRGTYPQGWLFVAEQTPGGWEVGLEGSPEFSALAEEAPEAVVDAEEKDLFATSSGEFTTQAAGSRFRLPWRLDRGWTMSGGPHGWSSGYDRPYSALDFAGGDEKVRSVRQGKAYLMCDTRRGWIRVVHSDGYATDYYHLKGNIKPGGGSTRVDEGEFLGYTGTDVSCGGAAYGRHVHFALRRNGAHVALDGRTIGGWTFEEGQAYGGYATHKGTRRDPGERLRNYG